MDRARDRTKVLAAHLSGAGATPLARAQDTAQHEFRDVETSPFLRWNFAPIASETEAEDCDVVDGAIPAGISGTFVRNGPNPQFDFARKPYHWFDGDAMLHMVRVGAGVASYRNRFVQTRRLRGDARQGYSVGEMGEMLLGDFRSALSGEGRDPENGERMGRANTNVVFHEALGMLALEENDKPYRVALGQRLGDAERVDFDGKLQHNVTAHPKVDPRTGEMMLFGYSVHPRGPKCAYAVVSAAGALVRSFEVPIPVPVMMHDMAITPSYSVLLDWNYQFDYEKMAEGGNPWHHRQDIPARFGVLPRHAESAEEMRWFDVAPLSLFHFANAWEERGAGVRGGTVIVVVGCKGQTMDLAASTNPDLEVTEDVLAQGARLVQWRLDLDTGRATERSIGSQWVEFPVIDPKRQGLSSRFVYCARFRQRTGDKATTPWIDGVVRYDLVEGTEDVHHLPAHQWGGEFVFAPDTAARHGCWRHRIFFGDIRRHL